MTDSIIVEARNTVKQFGQGDHAVRALDDVSIKIRKGEFFTLLGPSGCGKTTLLRLIAGFEMPSAGQILLDGADVSDLPPNKRPVNTVFQSYALFPHLTVAENVGFGLEMQGRPKAEVRDTAARMLALVKLDSMANRKTSQLSGGQQQRVALARALAPKPKVLLLDEPLSALDLKLRKEMQIELKRLQTETGITFIFVTHDQEEALTMSDRIAVMSTGRLQQVGTPQEIYKTPVNRFVASFIGETNFLPATRTGDGIVLECGARIAGVRTGGGSAKVTVTIRPEHLHLVMPPDPGGLTAKVTNLVYMGTDMQCHAILPDGSPLLARISPDAAASGAARIGDTVCFRVDPASVQVLENDA